MTDSAHINRVLAQAAQVLEEAASLIPGLVEDADRLEAELREKNKQINALRRIVERVYPTPSVEMTPPVGVSARSAGPDIDEALRANPEGLAATQISQWLKVNNRSWAQSTIFNILKKGKDSGEYLAEDGKWFLFANKNRPTADELGFGEENSGNEEEDDLL